MKRQYQTADAAIAEINRRAEYVKTIIPAELLDERRLCVIEENTKEHIATCEKDRDYKYANFDRIVNQFGYGCGLRGVVNKARKAGTLTPELEKAFKETF